MARIKHSEPSGQKRRKGKPPLGRKPSRTVLRRLYIKEERSIREIAALQDCTKDMVARALKEYGIEVRTKVRKSGLRKYGLQTLRAAAKAKGIRGIARDLGIAPSTLSRFLGSEKDS